MAGLNGKDIKVSVGTVLVGGQQGCSINLGTETTDTTTKDSGVWEEAEGTSLTWAVDLEGLVVVDDEGLEALETAWETLAPVDIKYGTATDYKTGKAIIESLSQNAPQKDKCTYSVSLKGVGPLTKSV